MSGEALKKINVPGSKVYIVDADKDRNFKPCKCAKGAVQTKCDYYTLGDKPVCSDDASVKKALANLGLTRLFGNVTTIKRLMSEIYNFRNDKNVVARYAAADALGDIGDKSAVPSLLSALTNNKNFLVRVGAVKALSKIGDKSAVPSLLYVLKNDKYVYVRQSAACALFQIRRQ